MSVSGKYLTALHSGGTLSDIYGWTAEETGDVLDRTTGSFNGFEAEDMGVFGLHITAKGYMDVTTGSVNAIRRGTLLTDLQLYRDINDAVPAYACTEALVVRFTQGGEVRGKMEWTAEIHSRGDVITYSDPV